MNKEDFIQWRTNPVTHEFLSAVITEMDNIIADLTNTAGTDQLLDKYRCGVILGLKWLAEWQPELKDEPEDLEDDDDA